MRSTLGTILAVLAAASPTSDAHGQTPAPSDQALAAGRAGAAQAVAANQYDRLYTLAQESCRIEDAGRAARTVDERAAAAAWALECVEGQRAAAFAAATTAEAVIRVREAYQPLIEQKSVAKAQGDSEKDFLGLSWGLGFGYSFGFDESVDGAEIDAGGVVRVTSDRRWQPRLLLEFHKYFWSKRARSGGVRGAGPFVAVSATQDEVLSGVGMGLMLGFKARDTDSDGFSVGLGVVLDAKVRDLASGFDEDEPAPAGATEVRFRERSRWSGLLFVTRTM